MIWHLVRYSQAVHHGQLFLEAVIFNFWSYISDRGAQAQKINRWQVQQTKIESKSAGRNIIQIFLKILNI